MKYFFEIIKIVFFVVSMIVWLFFLRWKVMVWEYHENILTFLMPLYLVLCWLVIWYLIANFLIIKNDVEDVKLSDKLYMNSFIAWWVVWLVLAVIFIFMIN